MAGRAHSTGAVRLAARGTRPQTSGPVPGRDAAGLTSATAMRPMTMPGHRASGVAHSGRARIVRRVPAGSCRAAPGSAGEVHSVAAALGRALPDRVDSRRAARGRVVHALADHVLERAVVATTTDALPGVTETRATVARRRAATAMTAIGAPPGVARRSALGAISATTRLQHRVARGRPAICCTAATPC